MIITKYNAICNLGDNIDEVFYRALDGDTSRFEIRNSVRLGCINTSLAKISEQDYDIRANRLILKVLEPLGIESLDKDSTAVVVATTNSGVEEFETNGNPKYFQIGNSAEFVYNHFGFQNFYTSVSTACSSGIKAFSIARELLENKIAETVLVIGVDSIAKLPIYGFDSLEILSELPSNPFSKNRNGINIGEAATAFVLKNSASFLKPMYGECPQDKGEYIEICGIGETTDFYHSTTPDPDGVEAERAIRLALGNLSPEKVDYINLHGTGTKANDLMEARVIYNVFGNRVPASSTKPLTGHCLGAAASIEAALCCKLIEANPSPALWAPSPTRGEGYQVFPHIYDGEYDEEFPKIQLANKNTSVKQIKTCLSTSFGFGGTNCAMVLRAL